MKKPKKPLILIPIAVVAAVAVTRVLRQDSKEDSGTIRISGNIEVTATQVGFKLPGLVQSRLVSEGESVTNGQVVALLDPAEIERELAIRLADAASADAVLAELEAGTRPEEKAQAAAALDVARANAEREKAEFTRQTELFRQGVIPEREFDASQAASRVAEATVREREARLALLEKGPRDETIRAARARLEQAKQAAALAQVRLGYTTLRSPLDGIVLAEGVESGENVVAGTPVVTVGRLTDVWMRGYIAETDLGRVKIGQDVEVYTDTYPGKAYAGRLSFISSQAEFTPKNIETAEERVKLVYRIKIDIPNPGQELKPGMPADARIATQ